MGFRVVIRLTKFFTDERSFTYLYINENVKFINHLEAYISEMFDLKGHFCLMKDNFLLPSPENINIIQADEMISVIPLTEPFIFNESNEKPTEESVEKDTKKKKRKKNKDAVTENIVSTGETEETLTNKENISTQFSPEISNKKYKIVDNSDVFTAIKNIEEYHSKLFANAEEDDLESVKSKVLNSFKDHFPPIINGVSDGRIKKRKRVRIRKSKKNNQVEFMQSDSESNKSQKSNSYVLTNGKKNSHVRFPSTPDNALNILQNEIASEKIDKTPRIIRAIQPNMISQLKKSNVSLVNNYDSSHKDLNEKNDEQINGNASPSASNSKELLNVVNDASEIDSTVSEKQLKLTDLLKNLEKHRLKSEKLLKVDEIVMFKMLTMAENYMPIISNYILGKVIRIDSEGENAKIKVLDGHKECIKPSGKFELEDDEEEDDEDDVIDINQEQLFELRLVDC